MNFESSEAVSAAAPQRQPGGLRAGVELAGRYELQSVIASGGMATVWRGHDNVLDRPVAVKVLHSHLATDDGFVARFRREAIASARLSHNSIVAVYDTISDELDGARIEAIVMELIRGQTLRAVLNENPVLSPKAVVAIGSQIADALGEAHRAGIVHRDIKPANIMIDEDRRVVVTDFGIAKATKDADLTHTGTLLGTAKYLAPEQVSGDAIDPRADIYSLGVVLFEALVGEPPFNNESDAATALARLREPVPRCRERRAGVPVGLDEAIHRAMAINPDERYTRAADLKTALAAVDLNRQAPLTPPPAGPGPAAATGMSPVTPSAAQPSRPSSSQPSSQASSSQASSSQAFSSQAFSSQPPGSQPSGSLPRSSSSTPVPGSGPASLAGHAAGPRHDGTAIMSTDMMSTVGDVHDSKSRGGKERRRSKRGKERRGQKRATSGNESKGTLGRTLVGLLIIAGLLVAGALVMAGNPFGSISLGASGDSSGSAAIVDGFSFDPLDNGDEWGSRVYLAYDGDTGTRWYSKTYTSPKFSSSKTGVGVIFQLDGRPAVDAIDVTTTTQNWSADVYVSDELTFDPGYTGQFSPDQWGERVGGVSGESDDTTIDLDGKAGTYLLIWITDHGTTVDREGVTRNRIEINEIAFR